MNSTKNSSVSTIVSVIFLLVVVGTFFWMWTKMNVSGTANVVIDQTYRNVDVEAVKTEADNIIKERDNLAGMPVTSPAPEKIGRANPFQ